jgi:glycerate dehydrogenase
VTPAAFLFPSAGDIKRMKIVVLDGDTLAADSNSWAALGQLGEVEIHGRSSAGEVRERAQAAAVLITNKAPVRAEVIAQAPHLRFIAVSATGYDCVDVEAARRRGIPVANVPEYGTDSVAQIALALLLELCHHVGLHADAVQAGEWSRAADFCFWKTPLIELAGKTLGVVGFGRIGRRVGELAHAFGMAVLAHSRSRSSPPAYRPFAWAELDELFTQSDVISLHCPLMPQTAGMVDRRRLRLCKPGRRWTWCRRSRSGRTTPSWERETVSSRRTSPGRPVKRGAGCWRSRWPTSPPSWPAGRPTSSTSARAEGFAN